MKIVIKILFVIVMLLVGLVGTVFVAPGVVTNIALSFERDSAGLTKQYMQLSTGEVMCYLESTDNDSNKPKLVLLHGFGANKDNFTRVAKHLQNYHVLIPDLVGFGESTKQSGWAYNSERQAFRLRKFLIENNATHAHIGGSSMGGHIALAYAHKYPNSVKSLWLLNPGGFWRAPATPLFENFGKALKSDNPLIVKTKADYIKLYRLSMHQPPYVPEAMLGSMALTSIANQQVESEIAMQLVKDDIENRAKQVKVPTLIVWGDKDKLLSPQTANIAQQAMPQAQLIMMKDIGHLPMIEKPEQTARDYLAFLAKLPKK